MQQGDNERAKTLLQENMEVLKELEEEGNPATTLKRFHVLNLLGTWRSTRRTTTLGDSSVGGKPGVGQGNGIQITSG